MENEAKPVEEKKIKVVNRGGGGVGGGVYGLAFIGAAVYYIQHAETFGAGVVGVLKALIWPAMLVYKLMQFLNM